MTTLLKPEEGEISIKFKFDSASHLLGNVNAIFQLGGASSEALSLVIDSTNKGKLIVLKSGYFTPVSLAQEYYTIDLGLLTNGWYRADVVWNTNGTNIYLNAVSKGILSQKILIPDGSRVSLGSTLNGDSKFNGLLADFRLRTKARTSAEILSDYVSGLPLPSDSYTTYKMNFNNNFFGGYKQSGEYKILAKDMGQRITANIASHFISTNILAAGSSAVLQFRTSVDEVYWTPWRDFVPILTTFRYIEFRVLLSSVDGATTPEVSLLTDIIDVPDKDKYGISIVPVGGLWIHFDPNSTDASPLNFFYQQPSVVATANEQGKYAVVDESLVSLYRFKVVVYNSSGVDIGGKVMWIAKGY